MPSGRYAQENTVPIGYVTDFPNPRPTPVVSGALVSSAVLGSPSTLPGTLLLGAPLVGPGAPVAGERSIPVSVAFSAVVTATRSIPVHAALWHPVTQPNSDISIDGWTNQTGGPATYPDISEPLPDDATYIVSPAITVGASAPIIFGLPPMPDPGVGLGLRLDVRAGPVPSETTTLALRVDLLDASAVQVGSHRLVVAPDAIGWLTFTFSPGEADAYRTGAGFSTGGRLR